MRHDQGEAATHGSRDPAHRYFLKTHIGPKADIISQTTHHPTYLQSLSADPVNMAAITLQPYARDGLEIIRTYQIDHLYHIYATALQMPLKLFPEARCEQLETGVDYSTWSNGELDAILSRRGFGHFSTASHSLSVRSWFRLLLRCKRAQTRRRVPSKSREQ